MKLFRKREIPWPTWQGWLLLLLCVVLPSLLWLWKGEAWLSRDARLDARVLILEGWVATRGAEQAASDFFDEKYELIVATGPIADWTWNGKPFAYPDLAARLLEREGVPADRIVRALAPDRKSGRTFNAAVAAKGALEKQGITSGIVNVFSLGSHAARSRLVYQKVFGPEFQMGVIACRFPEDAGQPWWKSSTRTKDFFEETLGFAYEYFLNSGRSSNSPEQDESAQSHAQK